MGANSDELAAKEGGMTDAACDVCGSEDDLVVFRLMGPNPVCMPCNRAWYTSGEVTREGILAERLRICEKRPLKRTA